VAQLHSRALGSLYVAGLSRSYSNTPPHGSIINSVILLKLKLKLKLIYDRKSVGQSVLVSGAHLELMIRFFVFCLTIVSFLMYGTLSDERMGL
jgi:hypothetical protein